MNPAPKPAKKPKSARSPMRKTPLNKRNPKRRKSEFARAYGSKERVEWVKSLPCAWCRFVGRPVCSDETHNAHTEREGLSRKGHYSTIAPLGAIHHAQYDRYLPPFDVAEAREIVRRLAAETEARWLAVSGTPE